jgi:TonB family protein
MNENASPGDWVGSLIDQRFPLFEWLGSSESGELFRTELPGPQTQKAAIRLVPAEVEGAQAQFDDWAQAEGLSHPHLLRIFESGRGRIDENEFLYVVMELPDEALAHILPTRALSAAETGDMLPPVLDALAYLHSQGLVHGHLNPANILAVDDRLKLSTDKLQQTGHPRKLEGGPRIYDAPEIAHGDLTPASDIWSLGVTLVEALTQLPPIWNTDRGGDPIVPQFVPEPFAAIARKCLRVDPAARAGLSELEALLHPPAVQQPATPAPQLVPAAVERQAPQPATPPAPAPVAAVAVPAPKAEAPPKPPRPTTQRPALTFASAPRPRTMQTAEGTISHPKLSMPVIVGAVALLVVIIGALVMRSHKPQQEPAAPVQESQSAPAPATAPAPSSNPAPQAPASQSAPEAAPTPTPQAPPQPAPQAAAPAPPQTAAQAPAPSASPSPNPSGAANAKGEVAERVMPDILAKASHTIQGKVTVRVRVQVDASGAVTDASFDSEGPSHYFSNLAMQASRKWRFEPARIGGNPAASEWTLEYEFRRDKTDVAPVEVKP